MKNRLFVLVLLSAGLCISMLTGCIFLETDSVETGTLQITLVEENGKVLPYRYVFTAQHQSIEEFSYYHAVDAKG